jgi:hypothetical protein
MCVSMSPGLPVHFSNTTLSAPEVMPHGQEPVHVLDYQNKVQNQAGLGSKWGVGADLGPTSEVP